MLPTSLLRCTACSLGYDRAVAVWFELQQRRNRFPGPPLAPISACISAGLAIPSTRSDMSRRPNSSPVGSGHILATCSRPVLEFDCWISRSTFISVHAAPGAISDSCHGCSGAGTPDTACRASTAELAVTPQSQIKIVGLHARHIANDLCLSSSSISSEPHQSTSGSCAS